MSVDAQGEAGVVGAGLLSALVRERDRVGQGHVGEGVGRGVRDFVVTNLSASRDVAITETNLIFEHITGTALA